jgi:uncharacterized CHY-type Zn-finger protein
MLEPNYYVVKEIVRIMKIKYRDENGNLYYKCWYCKEEFNFKALKQLKHDEGYCPICDRLIKLQNEKKSPPYSQEEYKEAKEQGLDLDDWNDYVKFYGLGEEPDYD